MAKGKRVLPTDSPDSPTHASGTPTPLDTTISATGNASDFNGTIADLDPASTRHDDPSRDDPCRLGRRLPSLDGAALLPWLDSSNRYGCPFVELANVWSTELNASPCHQSRMPHSTLVAVLHGGPVVPVASAHSWGSQLWMWPRDARMPDVRGSGTGCIGLALPFVSPSTLHAKI
jgi:hypothetical protein